MQSLKRMPNLSKLNVSDNSLKDAGAKALAGSLKHVPNLSELHLSRTRMKEKGAKALARCLYLVPRLSKLDVSGNDSTSDAAIVMLKVSIMCQSSLSLI